MTGSLIDSGLADSARLDGQDAPRDSLISVAQLLVISIHHQGRLILCVFRGSNAGPHASMASSLSTEPYLPRLRGNLVRPVGFVSCSRHSGLVRSVLFLDPMSF